MPPLNLPWRIFGRPVKPVAFALGITMLILGAFSIADLGILGASEWSDFLGGAAFAVACVFAGAWWTRSQAAAEWALLGAFFAWGIRLWAILLVQGWHSFSTEGLYLSLAWLILAGGSYLLERADPAADGMVGGRAWTRR